MKKKMAEYWQEVNVVSVAPLSEERVSPFTGKRQYLPTGGLNETRVDQMESVSYENRPTRADLVVRTGDVIVARMKDTLKVLHISPELNGLIVSTGFAVFRATPKILPGYLYFSLRSGRFQTLKDKYAQGSTQKAINNTDLSSITLSLPPLPVQERIVQILQKADEIRRKRQEALELADAILPAMYRDVFGEPRTNPRGWEIDTLGNHLIESRYGTSARASEYQDGEPVLRIPNVVQRTIDTSELKYLQVSQKEREKLLLRSGDILVVRTNGNKDYVGRCAVFDLEDDYLFASYLIRLRVNTDNLNSHYVVAYLATPMGRQEIDTNSRTSAGQYNISVEGLKAIRIPIPPVSFQQKFVDQYEQWKASRARLEGSLREADGVFSCLLARTFTGQLTAEWEEANAEWIAQQVDLSERLPRLLLLALIRERGARAEKAAQGAVLVTALMKYAFLLQMEGNGRRRFYHFVPYHYGPFAKELYADLERLQADGLVTVDDDTDEDKTRITLANAAHADAALANLPDVLKEDVAAILDSYGNLDHSALLKTVYDKYPAYAKKSRVRNSGKGTSRKGSPVRRAKG
ncbi:MAG: restriction endonuclease subunit S [Thermodesulfobacteriota bacterium]